MVYQSTRSAFTADSADAILRGPAPDGGLFLPQVFPEKIDWQALIGADFYTIAETVLARFFDDFTADEISDAVRRAYAGKFNSPDVTPTVKVGSRYVLELFRGPTCAFKDVALSLLPVLMTMSAKRKQVTDRIMILTATSGDTGKAALRGFADVEQTGITVFYPHGGVSRVQQLQMATQEGKNVKVVAVRGNFDDCQTGVKNALKELGANPPKGIRFSSANSINIGRLVPQIVYYFKSYCDLVASGEIEKGTEINFCVPTGNFGDILAGYFAKKLGLPIRKLLCASNENDVLTDFLRTGTYNRQRPFYRTTSPSMDILVSSNLERLLCLLSGTERCAELMKQLSENGFYTVNPAEFNALQAEFYAGRASQEETKAEIAETWRTDGYLADPHTAVALKTARDYAALHPGETTVVLSTASPYKFPAAVLDAVAPEETDENEFRTMERLKDLTGIEIPAQLAELEGKSPRFTDVIEIAEITKASETL